MVQIEPEKARALEIALRGLVKLVKAVKFYPPAHPALGAAAAETHAGFTPLLGSGAPLVLLVRREGFFLDDAPLPPGNPILKKLSSFLFARRIQRLTILPDLSVRDLRAFAGCLTVEPAQVMNLGGIQEILQQALISTLWVNEADLARIQARKKELEAEKERLVGEGAELAAEAPVAGQQAESRQEATEERDLTQVLAELQHERSDQRYRQLLQELVPLIPPNLTESGRSQVLKALTLLCRNGSPQQKSEFRRQQSRQALQQIRTDPLLDCLLDYLCTRDAAKETREELAKVLVCLGGKVPRHLMERLAGEGDAPARRHLAEVLLRQGPAAVPVLIDYLGDERWYVVRNAVTILGELCAQGAIVHIQPLLAHPDVRVRREAVRALTRIGGDEAVAALLQIVQNGDPELRPHALLALGAMKSPAAVPTLLRLVEEPDPWVQMAEIKKEAIRALGEIGSAEALPSLLAMLGAGKLWRRTLFNELRAAAAMAIGDIGHPGAAEALQRATEDASPTVARAALQALKQLRKA